jgi:hypothetical protein
MTDNKICNNCKSAQPIHQIFCDNCKTPFKDTAQLLKNAIQTNKLGSLFQTLYSGSFECVQIFVNDKKEYIIQIHNGTSSVKFHLAEPKDIELQKNNFRMLNEIAQRQSQIGWKFDKTTFEDFKKRFELEWEKLFLDNAFRY